MIVQMIHQKRVSSKEKLQKNKKTVLFVCTHNSSRSQMGEGLLNTLFGNQYQAFSAGIQPTPVNAYAVEVMRELGIDLSRHESKHITMFQDQQFDYVITVCDNARETCPFFPGKIVLHQSFEDPSTFHGSIEDTLAIFRQVRDQIKEWLIHTFVNE